MFSDDPDGVIARWKPSVGKIAEATSADLDGSIWNVLGAIEDMPAPDDYQAMDDLIRESFGVDLVTVGPDLVAMGLIAGWNHVAHRIRRSALGNLIVAQAAA